MLFPCKGDSVLLVILIVPKQSWHRLQLPVFLLTFQDLCPPWPAQPLTVAWYKIIPKSINVDNNSEWFWLQLGWPMMPSSLGGLLINSIPKRRHTQSKFLKYFLSIISPRCWHRVWRYENEQYILPALRMSIVV